VWADFEIGFLDDGFIGISFLNKNFEILGQKSHFIHFTNQAHSDISTNT